MITTATPKVSRKDNGAARSHGLARIGLATCRRSKKCAYSLGAANLTLTTASTLDEFRAIVELTSLFAASTDGNVPARKSP